MEIEKLKDTMLKCRDTLQNEYSFCECSDIIYTKKVLDGDNVYHIKLYWSVNLPDDFLKCYATGDISTVMTFDFDIERAEDMHIAMEIARVFAEMDNMLRSISVNLERYNRPRIGVV